MTIIDGEQSGNTGPPIADRIGIAVIQLLLDHVTPHPQILNHHQVASGDAVQHVLMDFDRVVAGYVLGSMDKSQLCLKWIPRVLMLTDNKTRG